MKGRFYELLVFFCVCPKTERGPHHRREGEEGLESVKEALEPKPDWNIIEMRPKRLRVNDGPGGIASVSLHSRLSTHPNV